MCLFHSSTPMPQDRFWSKVAESDSCWTWTAGLSESGYGSFRFGNRMHGAHRIAWMLTSVHPGDLHVLHKCDNRRCVNPEHLFLGTNADNVADRVRKGRSSSAGGERHGRAKLRAADIPAIRQRIALGEFQKDIARDYGVSQTCIGYLARGETWHAVQ